LLHAVCTRSRLSRDGALPALPPFPTRRSSDLGSTAMVDAKVRARSRSSGAAGCCVVTVIPKVRPMVAASPSVSGLAGSRRGRTRSEEHTSELQSLTNIVCRLLLEKINLHQCHV